MATITSAGTGNWGDTGTWVGGVVPVEDDKVIIAATHVVTVNGTFTAGDDTVGTTIGLAAINVSGSLRASRTVNSSLTCKGKILVNYGNSTTVNTPLIDYGTDGNNFSIPLATKLSWPAMGADGTLVGGWLLLTAGTHSYKLSGTKIDATNAGAYDFGNTVFSGTVELVNSSGGAVSIALPAGTSYTNTGPSITVTVAVDQADALITGIVAGSRLQIYNVTTATEMINAINATTSYGLSYPTGTGDGDGDIVRVRLTYCDGLDAKLPWSTLTQATSAGWTVLTNQLDDEVYIANGIDGSTCTEYTADYLNVQIDVSDPDAQTTIQRGYAWYCDQMTGDLGIAQYYGAMVAEDAFNYLLDTDVLDIKIQNTNMTTGVSLTGGALRRRDGSSPIAGGGSIYMYYGRTYGLETGVSGLTPTESDKLLSIPTTAGITLPQFVALK